MDALSWLIGWASATLGYLLGSLLWELHEMFRWKRKIHEIRELEKQARIALEIAQKSVESARGIRP